MGRTAMNTLIEFDGVEYHESPAPQIVPGYERWYQVYAKRGGKVWLQYGVPVTDMELIRCLFDEMRQLGPARVQYRDLPKTCPICGGGADHNSVNGFCLVHEVEHRRQMGEPRKPMQPPIGEL